MKLSDCLGRRVLYREYWSKFVQEAVVKEVSPSGKYVKLKYPSGGCTWVEDEYYVVEEVLE